MISDNELKNIVTKIVGLIEEEDNNKNKAVDKPIDEGFVPDISIQDLRDQFNIPNPFNKEEYLRVKSRTSARLGVWRTGPRCLTDTYLRFRADHAAAMDTVFTEVSEEFLNDMGLFSVSTVCSSKEEFLTRPDLGRLFSKEAIEVIKSKCKHNPTVQVYVSDGLSSSAVEAQIKDLLPSLVQGLKAYGHDVGTPFFVKHGRVCAMDAVTEALNSVVTVVLIGERPGLATSKSLSAYISYKGYVGMKEAGRTVVSNIHEDGTSPSEAGAHIAYIINEMILQKTSGLNLKI